MAADFSPVAATVAGLRLFGEVETSMAAPLWQKEIKVDGVGVSMDDKKRFMDNVVINRLRHSVKHEWVYL